MVDDFTSLASLCSAELGTPLTTAQALLARLIRSV